MLSKFESYIKDQFPFLLKEKSIVCCSGGVDSVVLFNLMLSLNKNFVVAHCNFKLRGEDSDKDEEFVKKLCKQNSIEFYSKSFDTKKIKKTSKSSIQMIARDLRYDFFDEISSLLNIKHILTAHHLNDSLESFLINISRGSGLDGLTGVPLINGKIKRPLIEFEKKDILEFASNKKLSWREDSSNKSNSYLRNKIRNKIIPEFDELEGNFLKNFRNTLKYLKMSNSLIHQKINEQKRDILEYKKNEVSLNISDLEHLDKDSFLYYFLRDYGFVDWDKILNLIDGESGKKIFSKSHVLFRHKNKLLLREINQINDKKYIIEKLTKNIIFENGASLSFTEVDKIEKNNLNIVTVDIDKLIFPLVLRNFNYGDNFIPYGMNGSKKISKFLKDNNVSNMDKPSKLILVNGDEKIIWVVGMRLDHRFRVKKESKNLFNIEYYK